MNRFIDRVSFCAPLFPFPMKIKKDEEIKTRVDGATKLALWQLAQTHQLDMSDVVRQALREFIDKQRKQPLELAHA